MEHPSVPSRERLDEMFGGDVAAYVWDNVIHANAITFGIKKNFSSDDLFACLTTEAIDIAILDRHSPEKRLVEFASSKFYQVMDVSGIMSSPELQNTVVLADTWYEGVAVMVKAYRSHLDRIEVVTNDNLHNTIKEGAL